MGKRSFGPEQAFLLTGHVLFLGLLVLAVLHHAERTIHVDSAFQIFKWIQLHEVEVEAHRYTAILPQLAVKLGKVVALDLKGLLVVASMAHVLVPYLIFLIAAYILRTPWIAIATALAAVLCTRLTFYGIVLEANYLLCYPLLLAAVIEGLLLRGPDLRAKAVTVLALVMILLVHPVGFLIALFVLGWYFLNHQQLRKALVPMVVLALAWGAFGRVLFPPSTYEADLYNAAGSGVLASGSGTNAALEFLFRHTWDDTTTYLPLWLLALATAFMLVRSRAWPAFGLFVVAIVGYVALNAMTYRAGETAMMMEKNFLPVAVLVALPLLSWIGTSTSSRKWFALVPFIAVVFAQFRGISFASRPAHERIVAVRSLVSNAHSHGLSKVAVQSGELDASGFHIHWALPFESLLISAIEGPEECVTVVAVDPDQRPPSTQQIVLPPLGDDFEATHLDDRYFILPEGDYVLISTPKN
jgi:hypothetical protein